MQRNKVSILCTKQVSGHFIESAAASGIDLEVDAFIETEPIHTIEVQQEIEQALLQTTTVVFTSGRAVEVVAAELDGHEPEWEIYCLGNSTGELARKYFGNQNIVGLADNAVDLADIIVNSSDINEVIFFCGDQRRPELPDQLHQKGIEVEEIVVYQTIPIPHKLKRSYDGVLFFSPSAVNSFFKLNKGMERTIFFAIGNTTAAEIDKHTKNKIIVSDEPSKERLVEIAIEFFSPV
ncbi:MAG TPA: uroporphyrinogen-III synthase [Chitinophagaceae bacterium]|nr:uroporphyrinogen-III synthase [Chitinophagaceae bacterium]